MSSETPTTHPIFAHQSCNATEQPQDQLQRRVVLLKVKRKATNEQNPSFLSLQRFVAMDLYPEDLTSQPRRSAVDRQNQQQRDGNELVSLFGNLDVSQDAAHPAHSTASPVNNQPAAFSATASGYIPSTTDIVSQNLTESNEILRQRYNIPPPSSSPLHSTSHPQNPRSEVQSQQLSSNTLFKRFGVVNQTDISTTSLQEWYDQANVNNSKSNSSNQSNPNHQTNQSGPKTPCDIAVYEVSTLSTIAQRISDESIRFQQHYRGQSGPKLTQTKPFNTTGIQPFRDQNYIPKTDVTRAVQMAQMESHPTSTMAHSTQTSQITAPPAIPGLKPPPPRRNKPVQPKTTAYAASQSTNLDTPSSSSLPLSTGQFLDADTLAYFEHRRMMDNNTTIANSNPNQTRGNDITTNTATPSNELDSTQHQKNVDEDETDVDVYDIYEMYVDITADEQARIHSSMTSNSDGTQPDAAFVLPNSEIDYLIAKAQFDGFESLFTDFHNFSQNLQSFTNVHEDFVNQFTKPRLQQYHIDQIFEQYAHSGLGELRGGGKPTFLKMPNEDNVEMYETGLYDDDYHPDFDSDMDYPDQSDGENDENDENDGNDDVDDFDDDNSTFSSKHRGSRRNKAKGGFVSMFDKFQQSTSRMNRYAEEDEQDDGDDGYDTRFRFSSGIKGKIAQNNKSRDELDDAEDPMLREFVLLQQLKYQHNMQRSLRLMNGNGNGNGNGNDLQQLPGQMRLPIDADDDDYEGIECEKVTFMRADDFCDDDERNEFGIQDGVGSSDDEEDKLNNEPTTVDTRKLIDLSTLMADSDDEPKHNTRSVFNASFDDAYDDAYDDGYDDDNDALFKQFAGSQKAQYGDMYGGSNAFQQFQKGRPVNYDQ